LISTIARIEAAEGLWINGGLREPTTLKKGGAMYRWVGLFALVIGVPIANAQDLYVYPNQGQSPDQQEQDQFDCYRYGRDQTGFDPMEVPTATAPPPEQKGSVVGGAARGALLGAAVGAVSGDAGKGAGYGAAAGGVMGGMRKNQSSKQQQQWEQEQAQNYQQNRNNYNRAYAACLEGRGYTVR
jgi:hypothetical protein